MAALVLTAGVGAANSAFGQDPDRPAGASGEGRFAKEDVDGDGRITRDEARTAALEWFSRFDMNGDGQVTGAEAHERAHRWRLERGARRFAALDRDHDSFVSALELGAGPARFAWLDRDADRRLTPAELGRDGEPSRCGGGEEAALRSALWRRDLDRDGRVTREETLRAAERRFTRKDRNRDGTLSRDEAPRRPRADSPARAAGPARHGRR
jgi:Ca2+-binding EF-hand superfamily protein